MDDELLRVRERVKDELLARAREEAARRAAPAEPVRVSDGDFDVFVARHPVAAVDLWAPWCGPCRVVGPLLEELAREWQGRIVIGKLNVDENPRTPARFQVQGIPTILGFQQGRLAARIVGALPKAELASRLMRLTS